MATCQLHTLEESEKEVMCSVCSQILAYLGGEMILQKRYQDIHMGLEGTLLKFGDHI